MTTKTTTNSRKHSENYKAFKRLFAEVIGPDYRGAAYPSFNPYGINEKRFDDCLRFKSYKVDCKLNGDVIIDWMAQEEYRNADSLFKEIKRCFKVIMPESCNVIVNMSDRYSDNEWTHTIKIIKKKKVA